MSERQASCADVICGLALKMEGQVKTVSSGDKRLAVNGRESGVGSAGGHVALVAVHGKALTSACDQFAPGVDTVVDKKR